MFPLNFVLGKLHITALSAGQKKGCGKHFFDLRGEIDTEWVFADGSHVRAHQHASGEERAIARSCGGATTKIHVAADAHGLSLIHI